MLEKPKMKSDFMHMNIYIINIPKMVIRNITSLDEC